VISIVDFAVIKCLLTKLNWKEYQSELLIALSTGNNSSSIKVIPSFSAALC